MAHRFAKAGLLALGMTTSGVALAQDDDVYKPLPETEQEGQQEQDRTIEAVDVGEMGGEAISDIKEATPLDRVRVQATAGFGGMTGQLGASSSIGPLYGVTVGGGWRGVLSFEAGYEGSRHGFDDPRVSSDAALWRHNLNALGKAGLPFGAFTPFVGVGLGGSYVNVNDQADEVYRNDFFTEVPVAVGLEFNRGNLTAGVRGTYRFLVFDEFAEPTPEANNPSGGLLTTSLTVGARF